MSNFWGAYHDSVQIINKNNMTYCVHSQNNKKSYYVLVFEKKKHYYVFKTAYPVTDKHSRQELEKILKKNEPY